VTFFNTKIYTATALKTSRGVHVFIRKKEKQNKTNLVILKTCNQHWEYKQRRFGLVSKSISGKNVLWEKLYT